MTIVSVAIGIFFVLTAAFSKFLLSSANSQISFPPDGNSNLLSDSSAGGTKKPVKETQ